MAYVTSEARQELLDAVAEAIDDVGGALAALGEAFELLDDDSAERLESELFRPVQSAYGRLQRTHGAFAARHGLPGRTFEAGTGGAATRDVRDLLERAVDGVADADETISTLQDSLRPVEVGDEELRAGLSEVRRLLGELEPHARQFVRSFGR
jgi:hypothetical protein